MSQNAKRKKNLMGYILADVEFQIFRGGLISQTTTFWNFHRDYFRGRPGFRIFAGRSKERTFGVNTYLFGI